MKHTLALLIIFSRILTSTACTTIIIGKKASIDGSVMIARNADGDRGNYPSLFVKNPPRDKPYTYTAPNNIFHYEVPAGALAYSGLPDADPDFRAYESAGINAAGVGLSAPETIHSNALALQHDPYDAKGIVGSSIPSMLLPQIRSARQGVELLGQLIEKRGASEGFGVAIADANEAWYLESAGGHRWLAVRIPDDAYFVSANQGRIGLVDLRDRANVRAAQDLLSFALDKRLTTPRADGRLDFFAAYSQNLDRNDSDHARVAALQSLFNPGSHAKPHPRGRAPLFLAPARKLSRTDVQHALQHHYQGSEHDPYGRQDPTVAHTPISHFRTADSHVLQLRQGLPDAIAHVQYLSLGMTALSLYVPFYQGSSVPAAYQMGNHQADSQSAWWRFRKLQILAMQNFPRHAPLVKTGYAALNQRIQQQQNEFETAYLKLFRTDPAAAQTLLEDFTRTIVFQAFDKTEELSNQITTQQSMEIINQYDF